MNSRVYKSGTETAVSPRCILQGKPQNYFRTRSLVNARFSFSLSFVGALNIPIGEVRVTARSLPTIGAPRELNEPRRNSVSPKFYYGSKSRRHVAELSHRRFSLARETRPFSAKG